MGGRPAATNDRRGDPGPRPPGRRPIPLTRAPPTPLTTDERAPTRATREEAAMRRPIVIEDPDERERRQREEDEERVLDQDER